MHPLVQQHQSRLRLRQDSNTAVSLLHQRLPVFIRLVTAAEFSPATPLLLALAQQHRLATNAEKTSRLAVAQLPMQRRPASSWSPATETSLMRPEIHRHLSDTPCVRNTALFRAHDTSPVTAHTACRSSVYSINRNRLCYSVMWLSLRAPTSHSTLFIY
jgi:hypothetical protein